MDLWIRSQDRTLLTKIDYIYLEPNYKREILGGNHYMINKALGIYKSEERALEVLEEIQGKITQNECLKTMIPKVNDIRGYEEMYGNLFKKMVYEMPLE